MGKTYEEINCDKKQTHEVLKNVFFLQNICTSPKKAVPLRTESKKNKNN